MLQKLLLPPRQVVKFFRSTVMSFALSPPFKVLHTCTCTVKKFQVVIKLLIFVIHVVTQTCTFPDSWQGTKLNLRSFILEMHTLVLYSLLLYSSPYLHKHDMHTFTQRQQLIMNKQRKGTESPTHLIQIYPHMHYQRATCKYINRTI